MEGVFIIISLSLVILTMLGAILLPFAVIALIVKLILTLAENKNGTV